MLIYRVLTALVLIPVIVSLVLWAPGWAFFLLCALATAVGLHEFTMIVLPKGHLRERIAVILLGTGWTYVLYALPGNFGIMGLTVILLLMFFLFLTRPGDMKEVTHKLSLMILGLVYVPLLFSFVPRLRELPHGRWWIFTLFMVIFAADTAAYFVGRWLGKRKLYPLISPGKTVAGAMGGLMGSVAAVFLAKLWFFDALKWYDCLAVAIPASLLGQVGDLCESMLKRSFGVKDSGKILPGHGGILDRVDALIFAAPFVFFYAENFGVLV